MLTCCSIVSQVVLPWQVLILVSFRRESFWVMSFCQSGPRHLTISFANTKQHWWGNFCAIYRMYHSSL